LQARVQASYGFFVELGATILDNDAENNHLAQLSGQTWSHRYHPQRQNPIAPAGIPNPNRPFFRTFLD